MRPVFRLLTVAVLALGVATPLAGQLRVRPVDRELGTVGLGLVLRKLGSVGTFMMATAHPDDENNALLVRLGHGEGHRVALVSATRGEGGQNEIGPELFDALSVLRTEELLAVHRFDGAEQYFTRAMDFGYSFSQEETFERWGREAIIGDFVRLIRSIRPDVIAGLRPEGQGGGQHHQASAVLIREAFRAAGDPSRFPEQLAGGLRPWQARKLYFSAGFGPRRDTAPDPRLARVDLSGFDALLGRTYAAIGSEARSMHKCQGMAQLIALPGPASTGYRLVESTIPGATDRVEDSLFDGVDTSLQGLIAFAGSAPPAELAAGLAEVSGHAATALTAFEHGGVGSVAPAVFAGLIAVRDLRGRLDRLGLDDGARFEIDSRLARTAALFEDAAILAYGMDIEALADDGVVVAGQGLAVSLLVSNRGSVGVGVRDVAVSGLETTSRCAPGAAQPGQLYSCTLDARVPASVRLDDIYWRRRADADRYDFAPDAPFGLPFRPTPFTARFLLEFPEATIAVERAIEHRYEGDVFSGEKRMELAVVPALSVESSPEIAIVPVGSTASEAGSPAREVRVRVVNGGKGPATADVALEAPPGWTMDPPAARVSFAREDEAKTARFVVTPGESTRAGTHIVTAAARSEGRWYREGYQVVEYPHIRRRQIVRPAETTVKILDVAPPPPTSVGYVMGVGDQVPQAIAALGATVQFLDREALAYGDLARYDVIVTGVRAYERRDDLRAHNDRLLNYVERGGTLIVQYNKFEFNQAQYGPYPARVGSGRVTDERSPVEVLVPDSPVFTTPNRIGPETWAGWVQERGLYFLGERDARYVDLLRLEDTFPFNPGEKTGALVEARHGAGRWIYVGLGLWRQLPAGTPGAYALLANLLSLRAAVTR